MKSYRRMKRVIAKVGITSLCIGVGLSLTLRHESWGAELFYLISILSILAWVFVSDKEDRDEVENSYKSKK